MITANFYEVPSLDALPDTSKELIISVPGSKSITNRALLLAMLANGKSNLTGILFSDDSRNFIHCLESLKFDTMIQETTKAGSITGLGGKLPCSEADLQVGSAGTAARFLSSVLGVSKGRFHMDASMQMRKRPMAPLLNALRELGCSITFDDKEDHFPFTLNANGFQTNHITIDIDKSSQFLSGLLIAAPLAGSEFTIHTIGTHGMAYIRMTIKMMQQFGVKVLQPDPHTFVIPAGQQYTPLNYAIEPDVSAACYFFAMAAILGISVTVKGVHKDSLQGDIHFLDVLSEMGCTCQDTAAGIRLTGPAGGKLKGIQADLSTCSDQAITLAAIAPFADSPVTIQGIGHIRHQESDRIAAIVHNLTAMGIRCEEAESSVTIYPGAVHEASIATFDDHRLAMGFSLPGLLTKGIIIEDPGCCRKTFEDYFEVLEDALMQLKN